MSLAYREVMFSPPILGSEEIDEVIDTLRSNWLTTGPKTQSFQTQFAEYVNAEDALALNSCTAALHIALIALGVGPGDEVITTTLTFAATVNVIEHVGAKPVLVDIHDDTLNINPDKVRLAITPRTKAIIAVHYAGQPVQLEEIEDIAKQNGIKIIEDAAHALPAKYKDKFIGSTGNPTAFSFYANKNMTTCEGGMLTGSKAFINATRDLALHGLSREAWKRFQKGGTWEYDVERPGFKYNMTDVQASIGQWQLKKLERFQARRRNFVRRYLEAFNDIPELQVPFVTDEVSSAWHLFVVRLNEDFLSIDRDGFIGQLKDLGVGTSVHYRPIHTFSFYKKKYQYNNRDFPVACHAYRQMVSLPLSPALNDEDISHVIKAVQEVIRKSKANRLAA